jgi:glutamate formiminotransferase
MKTDHKMPPEKVFSKASVLLERMVTILDYQSDRFVNESVESFSANQQDTYEKISAMLSEAARSCGMALDKIEQVRGLLK